MEIAKELLRTKSFSVFIAVAVLGAIETIHPLPFAGLAIALLTILGISLQGAETVLAQKEIEQARGEAAKQHAEATQEIKKVKEETLLLIKWVPRVWFFIYSVADKLVTPTVMGWIRRRYK